MSKCIDLTGRNFGRLTVIERVENDARRNSRWLCRCECGKEKIVLGYSLKNGNTTSCGCYARVLSSERLKKDNYQTKHGKRNTRLYRIYAHMKERCYNENAIRYDRYGARGITVCDEWLNAKNGFANFYDWAMSNGYKDNLTIDRINNDGNYEPSNCRWIDKKEQMSNYSRNHLITYEGKTQTISQWADEYKINRDKFYARINKLHWNIEKALNTP